MALLPLVLATNACPRYLYSSLSLIFSHGTLLIVNSLATVFSAPADTATASSITSTRTAMINFLMVISPYLILVLYKDTLLWYNESGSCRTIIAYAMCACQHVLQGLFSFPLSQQPNGTTFFLLYSKLQPITPEALVLSSLLFSGISFNKRALIFRAIIKYLLKDSILSFLESTRKRRTLRFHELNQILVIYHVSSPYNDSFVDDILS